MNFKNFTLCAIFSTIIFCSCTDDNQQLDIPLGAYDRGVLILNQGGYTFGNASISYLSNDLATLQNNIYQLVNPTQILGDVGQNIGFYNNLAFIVVNNSNKIEVVNRFTMARVTSITTGLRNPRYITFANGKGYVTNWGDSGSVPNAYIAVLDLSNYSVSSTIAVVEGPEHIIVNNDLLYVAHEGGLRFGNSISVINTLTNAVSNVALGGDVPNSLEIDNGYLYVMCGGKEVSTHAETLGKLIKIDLSNNSIFQTLTFPPTIHPGHLEIESNMLYYTVDSQIFITSLTATTLPTTALFNINAQSANGIYSFAVKNSKIFVGDAGNYSDNGKIYIYTLAGSLINTYTVGIIPAGFYFNQ